MAKAATGGNNARGKGDCGKASDGANGVMQEKGAKAGEAVAPTDAAQDDASQGQRQANPQLDPQIAEKIIKVRARVRESFGNVAMAMMMLPRYRHQTLGDLQHLLLEPLIRDRIAIAYPAPPSTKANNDPAAEEAQPTTPLAPAERSLKGDSVSATNHKDPLTDVTGMAIWASVSQEVDAKIREQIRAGVFPVRLKAEDWTSGDINWLLDIIAPDKKTTTSVIANFKQVIKDGDLRLHPIVTRLVDDDVLEKMGAQRIGEGN